MAITISDTEPRVQYTATAGQTSFTVPFEFFANADLKVFNGTTQLTFAASPSTASEYSVSGAGQTGGGSITLGAPGATLNDIITIYRDLAIERTTDFPTSGAFQIDSLNTELDKIIAMAQQLERDLKFSPKAAATTANTFDITFPNLVANKVLSVNSAGNGLEFAQDITDIITIAGIASDVTTVSGIAANVTAVANDATDIGTVATNIASVNTVATNIADVIKVADDLNEAVSEVETVANDLNEAVSEIDTVANNIADVNTVGNATNINNITLVAGQISPTNNIATIAGLSTEIGQVAAIDSDVTAVANINSQVTTVAGLNTEITGVYAISGQITSVNSNSSNINTVATNLLGSNTIGTVATDLTGSNNIGTVATNIASVTDVSNNIGSVNDFAARYRVSATAPTTSLDIGDLYYDTTTDAMKVYGSSGWQNAGSSVNGTSQRYNYTATSGQTTFTGTDNNGNTLTYDAGYIDVYLNGVKLLNGTDVTVTSGSSVVLASGATTGDVVDIVAYGTFSVASLNADNLDSGTVPDARITGAYTGITNLTMSGDLTVDTNTLKVDSTNNRVGISTSSPEEKLDLGDGQLQNFKIGLRSYIGSGHSTSASIFGHSIKARDSSIDGAGAMETTETNSGGGAPSAIRMHNGNIEFHTASSGTQGAVFDSERMRIYETGAVLLGTTTVGSAGAGDLSVNGGIFLGGTAAANKLDDYEEGLHTVTATDSGGGATIVMNTSYDQLAYTKIGRVVHIQGILLFASITGSFSGTLQISLPFTSSNLADAAGRTVMGLGTYNVDFTAGTAPYFNIAEGSAIASIQVSGDNIGGGLGQPQSSAQLYIGGSYVTDA